MKQKAPVETPISTGAVNRTAEAVQIAFTFSMRLQAVELKERFHDLPQLPDRM